MLDNLGSHGIFSHGDSPENPTGRRQILQVILLKLKKCHATPTGFICLCNTNGYDMNSNGYFTKSPKGSLPNRPKKCQHFQVLKVDGSRGNLDQAVARRVHMWIKIDQIHMTFFRYQVCNKGCRGVRL